MHMIPRNMALYNFNFIHTINLTDQLPYPLSNVGTENWLAALGDPDDMILDIVYGMTGFPVILNTASILKSSPEGEGSSPNPRKGQ
jgi:hypothetical protein